MNEKIHVLTRLRVVAYRGIEALDTAAVFPDGIPPRGFIVSGRTAAGKTSVLNAIKAALDAQDIGVDAIRHDHDRAEILVDMNDLTVSRVITEKGSNLRINRADAKAIPSPAAWLKTILGSSTFDAIELAQAKPPARKAIILSALPITVTPAQVAEWTEGWTLEKQPDYALHGLEVVAAVRKDFYDRRTGANARAKDLAKDVAALEAGAPPAVAGAKSVDDAAASWRSAEKSRGDLEARKQRASDHEARTASTRERVAKLRADASAIDDQPWPAEDAIDRATASAEYARANYTTAEERVRDLERQIDEAKAAARAAHSALNEATAARARAEADHDAREGEQRRAEGLREQAANLESAIAAAAEQPPTEDDFIAAEAAIAAAAEEHAKATAAKLRTEHEAKVVDAQTRLSAAKDEAARLDEMVAKFTKQIPNQLLADVKGIPGLAIEGDEVYLDDVRISKLSGREQLLFAVEIARRLNVRSKILIVDGLEKVDDDVLPDFVRKATADGYQLIATRVSAEDVHFEAITVKEDTTE